MNLVKQPGTGNISLKPARNWEHRPKNSWEQGTLHPPYQSPTDGSVPPLLLLPFMTQSEHPALSTSINLHLTYERSCFMSLIHSQRHLLQ